MKNKVLLVSLAAVLALSLSIVGCEGEGPETFDFVFSDHNPEHNPTAQAMIEYAQYIEDNSDDRIEIEVHVGASLCELSAILTTVGEGTIDAGTYAPEIGHGIYYAQVVSMPFLGWPSRNETTDIFATLCDEFPEILAEFDVHDVYYLVNIMLPGNHFHFHAANKTVAHPDDMAGNVIMCLRGFHADIIDAIGATPMTCEFSELFTHLSPPYTGNGFFNLLELLLNMGFIEHLPSHTIFGEGGCMMTPIGIVWNQDSYDDLPSDLQQVVVDAYDVYRETHLTKTAVETTGVWDYMAANNHTVTELTPEQIEDFAAKCGGIYQDWIDEAPDPELAEDIYDRAVELIAGY